MNERLAKAEALFHDALELPPEQREAFLQQACADDSERRHEVAALLRAAGVADHWLSEPSASTRHGSISEGPGTVIGRYKLLQQIGEGGCGVVYMAEQEQPVRRRVALKVIKLGMDTKQVVARFEAERQALAMMDHPNIAKVLDAGATDTGRPYFVMELVRGIKITDYCDQNNLTTAQRLDLFIQICQAIQHAHQKGIIHRDLKPSNVLVTLHDGVPVPKVIDFGIAKATGEQRLTDKTLFTAFQQFIGTPAYMSPEQAEMSGLDIDTRTDIYALGVLLYELLTGKTPFDAKELMAAGLDEIRRTIREVEPVRPSTRLSQLVAADVRRLTSKSKTQNPKCEIDRDLDWMVMKCLEKDRARRYETASALALDIQRHRNSEPILARPPSNLYRLQKLIGRNKLVVAAGAMILATLVIGFAATMWSLVRERDAHAQAEHRRKEAEVARFGEQRQRQRTEAAVTRLEIERAELLFGSDRAADALAYLARVLRREPTNRVAAERIIAALTGRNFCLPNIPPLQHHAPVTSAEFSPDGTKVLTASKDKTARLWDSYTGLPLLEPLRHDAEVLSARFSPDGQRVITTSSDKSARIWAATTQRAGVPTPELVLQHEDAVNYAEFSFDGTLVLTASEDKSARVWDALTGRPQTAPLPHSSSVKSAHFSPDGTLLVTMANESAQVWNALTGEARTPAFKDVNRLRFAEFSPDGQKVVTGGISWGLRLWDVQSGKQLLGTIDYSAALECAQFSPDSLRLAWGGEEGKVRVLNAQTAQPMIPPLKHDAPVASLEFSSDGQRLLTTSGDKTARIWDLQTGEPLTEPMRHETTTLLAHFSADSRRVITVPEGNSAYVWEVRTGPLTQKLRHGDPVRYASISANCQRLLTILANSAPPKIWDLRTCRRLRELRGHTRHVRYAQFSADGQKLVTTGHDRTARVWDTETGQALWIFEHPREVRSPGFSPDGQRIVTPCADKTARIWDLQTGKCVIGLTNDEAVWMAKFSEDGKLVVTRCETMAQIWNAHTGQKVGTPLKHDHLVSSVSFSADSRLVLTASHDKTARIWDPSTGRPLIQPIKHEDVVEGAAFSPDGQQLVTRSGNAVRIWDAQTGQPVSEPLKHEGRVTSVQFSPDGHRIVTASADMTLRIWDAETGHPISERLRHENLVTHAEFSSDGRWVASASMDGTARIWEMPDTRGPIPAWLSEWADAVAGKRFNKRNESEAVPPQALVSLAQRFSQSIDSDSYTPWVKWFFALGDTRAISPSSAITLGDYVERCIAQNSLETLREAVALARDNPCAVIRLAQLLLGREDTSGEATTEASLLIDRAVKSHSGDGRVWLATAEILQTHDNIPHAFASIDRATRAQSPYSWYVKGLLRQKQEQWQDAYGAFCKALELADRASPFPVAARANILLNRSRVLTRLQRPADAQVDLLVAKSIPSRSSQTTSKLIDLSAYYNESLDGDCCGARTGFLIHVPTGIQTFNDVSFDVRGVIKLAMPLPGTFRFPGEVPDIRVQHKCARLHFLHATHYWVADGTRIGTYRIHYHDDEVREVPIVYGEGLRDWVESVDSKEVQRGKLAWRGMQPSYGFARLYHSSWENPRPEIEIKTIDFVSILTNCAPFLVAITAQ